MDGSVRADGGAAAGEGQWSVVGGQWSVPTKAASPGSITDPSSLRGAPGPPTTDHWRSEAPGAEAGIDEESAPEEDEAPREVLEGVVVPEGAWSGRLAAQLLWGNAWVLRRLQSMCMQEIETPIAAAGTGSGGALGMDRAGVVKLLTTVTESIRRHATLALGRREAEAAIAALERFQDGVIEVLREVDRDLAERAVERLLRR